MALGEVLGEARGKVAGLRALGDGIIEVSLQGKGTLLGSEMEDVTTFGSVMRPNGTAYGQGNSIQMSTEGMAEWRGSGVGRPTPQANMKMMLMEITTGNYGNGNSDILKELIIRGRHFFIPICADIISSVVIPQLRKI